MALLEEMAEWAVSLRCDQIPETVLEAARLQVVSVLASVYSGAETEPGRACRSAALELSTRGSATVLPTAEKVSPQAAVLVNAAYSMAHDFDDYLFLGHTGHSAVLAALAVGEEVDATLEEMMVAQVAANEIAGRLGAFVAIGPHNGQLWAHIHVAAAAVIAARLHRLSAGQAADALAIGLYQPPYSLFPGFFGSDAKVLTAAQPAASGLYAARLAAGGMRGAADLLEHRRGLGAELAFLPLPELLAGLGRSWVSESLSYKIYPGCAYVDGPVDAALGALDERRASLALEEIDRVDIAATALTREMENLVEQAAPADRLAPIAINFSARRSVAIALLQRALGPRQLEPRWLAAHGDEIAALAAKTRVRESRAMTAAMLGGISRGVDLPALVRVFGRRRVWDSRTGLMRALEALSTGGRLEPSMPGRGRWAGRLERVLSRPVAARDALSLISAAARAYRKSGASFDMGRARFGELEFRFGAEVTVHLAGGGVLSGAQNIPLGAAGRPRSEARELVATKLEREAGPERAAAIEEILAGDASRTRVRSLAAAACSG